MSLIKEWRDYIKNNAEGYWFKAKLYGWGWTPAKWKGWLVTFLYVISIVLFSLTIDDSSSAREVIFTFALPVILLTITFIRIAYKKGEKPHWQWGPEKK